MSVVCKSNRVESYLYPNNRITFRVMPPKSDGVCGREVKRRKLQNPAQHGIFYRLLSQLTQC